MTQKFEYTVLDMIESATRTILTKPVNLGGVGGVGGGVGGPPGGFVGRLAQFNVAYDTLEAATLSTLPSGVTGASGWSLVDNLNHIRYRLGALETGSGVLIVDEADGSPSVSPTSRITFSGAVVTDLGGGHALVTISGGGGGLDTAAGDARYLKLDASNDPLTAQLDVIPSNPGDGGIYISTEGDAYPLDVEQISSTSTNVTSPALYVLQALDSTGNFNFGGHLIYGRRNRTGGGIFYTDLLRFETPSGVVFNVDKDGHAYDNGELLITEAPIDGFTYGRKDGDWVTVSGVVSSGGAALTVMEADGSPIVTNVDKIIFSGAIVTDLGNGDALVTFSGFGATEAHIDQTPDNGTYTLLSGLVNNSNTIYYVSAGSYISGSLQVFLNGQFQTQGSSYDWIETTPSGGSFTFITAPATNDIITAIYDKAGVALGNADTVDGFHASAFALVANGVTNGDSHDHSGGDGAQINHTTLSNIGTFTHAQLDDIDNSGWIPRTETWTRTGNHTFTVTGNLTTTFRKGTKVRYKDGGSYEYGVVASSAFSSVTTVTLFTNTDYAMAATTITDTYISYIENADGFPDWFAYSSTVGGFSGTPTQVGRYRVSGKTVLVHLYIEGTSNATTFTATAPVANGLGVTIFFQPARGVNNSNATSGPPAGVLGSSSNSLTYYIDWNASAWANTNTKAISGTFTYEF